MRIFALVPAVFTLSLTACGGSPYPVGKMTITAETTAFYYPKPEVAFTPENLAIIEKNAQSVPDCKNVSANSDGVNLFCGATTYAVAKNAYNPKVVAVACLGPMDEKGATNCVLVGVHLMLSTK